MKKSFVFEVAFTGATSRYLSPPYKVLVSLPATKRYKNRHPVLLGGPWASQEGSGLEILLKKWVWPALAAEANFLNICLRVRSAHVWKRLEL